MTDRAGVYASRGAFRAASAAVATAIVVPGISRLRGASSIGRDRSRSDNLHTGERLNTRLLGRRHAMCRMRCKHINWVLRDHRTDEVRRIDRRAARSPCEAAAASWRRREPFQVISGYRSPATNAMLAATTDGVARTACTSQGMAVDIRVPGRSLVKVHRAALSRGRRRRLLSALRFRPRRRRPRPLLVASMSRCCMVLRLKSPPPRC